MSAALIPLLTVLFPIFAGAAPAKQDSCDFCRINSVQVGPMQFSSFEPPPNTSNIFSSIILDQSEHFVLKVTRGAFIPFYFLIISKEHYTRVADLPVDILADLKEFKSHVERFYHEVLGRPFAVFEHGPARAGSRGSDCSVETGGGCVDHLHLHILPFSGNIESTADMSLPSRFETPRTLGDFSDILNPDINQRPYIFYQAPNGEMKLYVIKDYTPSQLLRLLIAEDLGLHEEYNWREFATQGDFWANAAQSVAGYLTWRTQGAATARSKVTSKGWNKRVSGDQDLLLTGKDCSDLLTPLEGFSRENPAATVGDLRLWLKDQSK